jgi:hypothetical protein
MAADATKVVVGQSGTVLAGTLNTTLPGSATAATTGFTDMGYLDADGVTMTVTPSVEDLFVWQSQTAVRRIAQNTTIGFAGKFAEWNANVIPYILGGGTVTAGTYSIPDSPSVNNFAGVIDVTDGSVKLRFTFPSASQTEAVEAAFNRQGISTLSFNYGVLAPGGGTAPLNIYKNSNF